MPHDLHMFRFIINFASCFTMGKSPQVEDIPKMWGWTLPSPWSPSFEKAPPRGALP
jgi:hypothetical protein